MSISILTNAPSLSAQKGFSIGHAPAASAKKTTTKPRLDMGPHQMSRSYRSELTSGAISTPHPPQMPLTSECLRRT